MNCVEIFSVNSWWLYGRGGNGNRSDSTFLQTVLMYNAGQRIFPVVCTLDPGSQEMHNHFILFHLVLHLLNFMSLGVCLPVFFNFETHTRCFPTICFTRLDDVLVYVL